MLQHVFHDLFQCIFILIMKDDPLVSQSQFFHILSGVRPRKADPDAFPRVLFIRQILYLLSRLYQKSFFLTDRILLAADCQHSFSVQDIKNKVIGFYSRSPPLERFAFLFTTDAKMNVFEKRVI